MRSSSVLAFCRRCDVVDDGRERRLDVVRDVGYELGLEPLGLHALGDLLGEAVADAVEVLGVGFELPVHMLGVYLLVKLALGQLLSGFFDALHLPRAEDGRGVDDDGEEKPHEQPASAFVIHQYKEYEPDDIQPQHDESRGTRRWVSCSPRRLCRARRP